MLVAQDIINTPNFTSTDFFSDNEYYRSEVLYWRRCHEEALREAEYALRKIEYCLSQVKN